MRRVEPAAGVDPPPAERGAAQGSGLAEIWASRQAEDGRDRVPDTAGLSLGLVAWGDRAWEGDDVPFAGCCDRVHGPPSSHARLVESVYPVASGGKPVDTPIGRRGLVNMPPDANRVGRGGALGRSGVRGLGGRGPWPVAPLRQHDLVPLRPQDVVRRGYDAIGSRYTEWSAASEVRLRFVGEMLDRVPAESWVLDLGCGAGEPATRLLSERCNVIGVDLSEVQIGMARRAAPAADFVIADITRFALRPASVQGVASFYALGHVPAAEHEPLLRVIADWLRPGGVLVTSAPIGASEGVEEGWLGVPMFFGGIGQDATIKAAKEAGLQIELAERVPEDEGDGRTVEFLWLIAHK